jgi:hypothetical protein
MPTNAVSPGRRALLGATLAFTIAAGLWAPARSTQAGLPARLSDAEFWALIGELSEPDGFFRSDNLVSNEDTFQLILPDLQRTVKPGGVYVGVGPDQNFTYIAALKPAFVFIPDIRRGNLHMHLMYKALMELSPDRTSFLARLFSRRRPDGLSGQWTPQQLFQTFGEAEPDRNILRTTMTEITATLRTKHKFTVSDADIAGIEYILGNFFTDGPFLQYASSPVGRTRYPSFAELQTATDGAGVARAYLATEDHYRAVRALQQNNLIVPLVGNFSGPKTLQAIGAWVRTRGAKVTTFYTSNVENYLFQEGQWSAFAANVASWPLDDTSTLIRSCFNTCVAVPPNYNSRVVMLLDSMPAMVKAHQDGRINNYFDLLSRRR